MTDKIGQKLDVEVKSGEDYVISDQNRNFGTLTIHQGGTVHIITSATVTIDVLKKEIN